VIVCIESPFKPSEQLIEMFRGIYTRQDLLRQNIQYARLALQDSLERGESPFASHLLYTQVWAETDELRAAGIMAAERFRIFSDKLVLCQDLGVSTGMSFAKEQIDPARVEMRNLPLPKDWRWQTNDMGAWRATLNVMPFKAFQELVVGRWAFDRNVLRDGI
jgi:hypothetical protein